MHPSEATAVALIVAVHFISLTLAVLALMALRRTGNRRLLFVAAAFFLFATKSMVTAYSLVTDFLHHEDLEAFGSLLDLFIVLLLIAPFLVRSNAKPTA